MESDFPQLDKMLGRLGEGFAPGELCVIMGQNEPPVLQIDHERKRFWLGGGNPGKSSMWMHSAQRLSDAGYSYLSMEF